MNLYVGTSGYPYKEWNGSVEIKKRIGSINQLFLRSSDHPLVIKAINGVPAASSNSVTSGGSVSSRMAATMSGASVVRFPGAAQGNLLRCINPGPCLE
jgi:hypothetical protein